MRVPKIEVGVNKEYLSETKISVDIDEIPSPTAIFILSKDEVILNKRAYKTLSLKVGEEIDLAAWRKINPYLRDCFKKVNEDIIFNDKVHIILLNGKHEIMNYSLTRIMHESLGVIFIIHFSKASEKYSVASISSLYSIREEISKLKPYLNRSGKLLHESLMNKYFREENQQLTLDDLVYYEKELRIIQKAYPLLSHREVILCGLLVNNMDSKDIASITNRTLDAVFVTIHRINKKLNIPNKKLLVQTLKTLVSEQQENELQEIEVVN